MSDFLFDFFKTCRKISGTPNTTYELFLTLPDKELKEFRKMRDPLYFLIKMIQKTSSETKYMQLHLSDNLRENVKVFQSMKGIFFKQFAFMISENYGCKKCLHVTTFQRIKYYMSLKNKNILGAKKSLYKLISHHFSREKNHMSDK